MAVATARSYWPAIGRRDRVAYFLEVRGLKPREIDAPELSAHYPGAAFGWAITLPTLVGDREVDVVLRLDYPYEAALIGIARLENGRPLVHVVGDVLCLSDNAEPKELYGDEKVLAKHIDSAAALFAQTNEQSDAERASELVDYWNGKVASPVPIYSLIRPETPYGPVVAWHGEACFVVASDEATLNGWLLNRFRLPATTRSRALYLPEVLDALSIGDARELRDAVAALADPTLLESLDALAVDEVMSAVILFRVPGPFVLVGGVLRRASSGRPIRRKVKYAGFRPGKVPPKMLVNELFGSAGRFERHVTQRADAEWVFARGGDGFDEHLMGKHVCLIGVGSLGSPIARALIKAGVGHLTLVDPKALRWDNIGRHELGGQYVGSAKAAAVAKQLRADFPFSRIEYHTRKWQDALRNNPALFDCDLVLSTTGDWPGECQLNDLLSATSGPRLMFAWLEAHAAAAQVLVVGEKGGCLACGMDAAGWFESRATDWPTTQIVRVPACGETYAPYSDLAAARARALIAGVALEVLHDIETPGQLVTELYDVSLRSENGGSLNASFVERLGREPSPYGEHLLQEWKASAACVRCAQNSLGVSA